MKRISNIAVIGLDDFHLELLQTVRGADNFRFHGLIPYHQIVNPKRYPVEDFIHRARRELSQIDDGVDAIIGHWDFPTTSLLPVLLDEAGLPGPALEPMMLCDNKYGVRLAEVEEAPQRVPRFALVDPNDDAIVDDPPLPYPFWLKPVVAFSSTLGFRIDSRRDLVHALPRIRSGIGKFADPFNRLMQHGRFGDRRALLNGGYCIAEQLISGRGCTVEGYILDGEPHVYAVIDSIRGPNAVSFVGYHYPTELPDEAQSQIVDATHRIIRHIGLERTTFNVEFFWDEDSNDVKLLEVNSRLSKSHAPLFHLVDGASHHEVAIDVALGKKPEFPRGDGRHRYAAKFMPRAYDAARVTRVPTQEDVEHLRRVFPCASFKSHVQEGMELTDLPNQDSYSFELGDLFLGGQSRDELAENFCRAMQILGFRFSHTVETNYE